MKRRTKGVQSNGKVGNNKETSGKIQDYSEMWKTYAEEIKAKGAKKTYKSRFKSSKDTQDNIDSE